jgi:branched-chain amino acid transport system permease protein
MSLGTVIFLSDTIARILVFLALIIVLDLKYGFTDIPNFGITGFFALGAYTTAVITATDPQYGLGLGLPWWTGWLASILVVAAIGALISLASLRVDELYLGLVTFAFAEITLVFIRNLEPITGGSLGLIGIDPILPAVTPFLRSTVFLVATILLVATFAVGWYRIATAPLGRVLQAIRVDELVAETSGKHAFLFKVKIFTLGSAAIGLVGGFWATYNGGIVPNMFELQVLLLIWIGMILGGNRRLAGLVVGAVVIFSLRIGTRFVSVPGLSETQFASLRGVLIGLLLIGIILYRPQGLLGNSKEIL